MEKEKPIRKAQIIHNITAGNAEHKKDDLIAKAEAVADGVQYLSTNNPMWSRFTEDEPDVIFLGGGDGTVHKLAEVLLNKNALKQRTPICLLPLGTANNIAKTLNLPLGMDMISKASPEKAGKFDIGRVNGLEKDRFFLEAAGFGIFPKLVAEMEQKDDELDTPSEELKESMQTLVKVISNYEAKSAEIIADGKSISGKFLLIEVMNIKYIGPNFEIAPEAEISDGYFDLVLVREEDRNQLLEYVQALVEKKAPANNVSSVADVHKVKKLEISWKGKDVHIDDEIISDYSGESLEAEVEPDALRFIKSH